MTAPMLNRYGHGFSHKSNFENCVFNSSIPGTSPVSPHINLANSGLLSICVNGPVAYLNFPNLLLYVVTRFNLSNSFAEEYPLIFSIGAITPTL